MKILVTGGAGYIGSHTCVELLNNGYDVVVVDNLKNSSRVSLDRVQEICGRNLTFVELDLRETDRLDGVFGRHQVEAVIHFAGLKAVGESVSIPLAYYQNNIAGTLSLLDVMQKHRVKNLVFSSSATVYGDPEKLPIQEDFPLSVTNPYGRTKLMIEEILKDVHLADPSWNIALLRYFNPVGAHESGMIGEDPDGIPNNLMPYVAQVAVGKLPFLRIFGNDYPTPDGTGVRDYIHVCDLAAGHLKALPSLMNDCGLTVYNLGTGRGFSVLDMVKAFETAAGRSIPYQIVDRRPGDIAACWADPAKANRELGWRALLDLNAMCLDAWRWQKRNPQGFKGPETIHGNL